MNNNIEPLVSVIIPTYKRPLTLSRAIDSVIASTYSNIEVIVVDDNNDGDEYRIETEKLMSKYLEGMFNINYIKHNKNLNGSAARNTGIKYAKGKYIMFLDDDDEFTVDKIKCQVHCLEIKDESWGACYCNYVDIYNEKIVSKCFENKEGVLLVEELARNFFIHAGSNLMVRKNVVIEINGFDESFLRNQDVEFLIRILKKYKIAHVNIDGLKVHMHKREYLKSYYELTDHYLMKFKKDIDVLKKEEKNAVYTMIGLQLFRHAFENRDYKKMNMYMGQYHLKPLLILSYFKHLLYRKITKKSFGFDMSIIKNGWSKNE